MAPKRASGLDLFVAVLCGAAIFIESDGTRFSGLFQSAVGTAGCFAGLTARERKGKTLGKKKKTHSQCLGLRDPRVSCKARRAPLVGRVGLLERGPQRGPRPRHSRTTNSSPGEVPRERRGGDAPLRAFHLEDTAAITKALEQGGDLSLRDLTVCRPLRTDVETRQSYWPPPETRPRPAGRCISVFTSAGLRPTGKTGIQHLRQQSTRSTKATFAKVGGPAATILAPLLHGSNLYF